MRAITHEAFGSPDVLRLGEVAVPRPGAGQVLVRIRAAAVNPWDWHFMRGLPYLARLNGAGIRRPKHPTLGGDIAGEVVATGDGATRFAVGDAVFGFIEFGGFAEYAVAPETLLAAMPRNVTFEQAAATPLAAQTALQGLRDAARVKAGDRVLVIGASGGVGTYAVQLAVSLGARVTGVASGRNAGLVRTLGADRAIDYTHEDVTTGAERYDVILQLAGTASAISLARILAPGGRLVLSSGDSPNRWIGPMGRVLRGVIAGRRSHLSIAPLTARWNAEDLALLAGLIESGVIAPVIDSTYALADTADAIRHLETGRARGKILVSVAADGAR
ncbi:MAG TPA: NAD(P)-dependent alcohol dehydrogenase [Candidatus Limnocylindrales bacterium]|nr:NAD(P)-dependent alcohol dehydrogenase [Candidatus Limnocylindrales bacterium]